MKNLNKYKWDTSNKSTHTHTVKRNLTFTNHTNKYKYELIIKKLYIYTTHTHLWKKKEWKYMELMENDKD